jgi:hypothetical protein
MTEEQKKPLIERYLTLVDVVAEAQLTQFGQTLELSISKIVDAKAAEINAVMAKVFAVQKSGPLNSNMIEQIRKATLENANTDKRTPAPDDKPTPDGNVQPDKIEQMFQRVHKGERIGDEF